MKYVHFSDDEMAATDSDDPQHDRYFEVLLTMIREACLQMDPEEK